MSPSNALARPGTRTGRARALLGDISSVDTLSSFEIARTPNYCPPVTKKGHLVARMRVFEQERIFVVLDASDAIEIARKLVQLDSALSCGGNLHRVSTTERRDHVALFGVQKFKARVSTTRT